jgi:hypothetical protein
LLEKVERLEAQVQELESKLEKPVQDRERKLAHELIYRNGQTQQYYKDILNEYERITYK